MRTSSKPLRGVGTLVRLALGNNMPDHDKQLASDRHEGAGSPVAGLLSCHDANGNMIRSDVYGLFYHAENRLVEVRKNGVIFGSFVYDGDGNRVQSSIGGVTTTFVGNHYEVSNDGSATTVTKYYYAGAQRIAMRQGENLYYLLADQLGSTSITTDADGEPVSELRYGAWGEVRYTSGSTPTKYTYTGQYSNMTDFGLMYYNVRWYDPTIARFTQADSIVPGGVQGLDRYAYANNNPVRYKDPSGHCVLVEDSNSGMCVTFRRERTYDAYDYYARNHDAYSYRTVIQVVHGGSIFPNPVEVGLANTMLSGDPRWLNGIPPSPEVGTSLVAVAAKLGYETGYGNMDPSLVLLGGIIDPGDAGKDDGYLYSANGRNQSSSTGRTEPQNLYEQLAMEAVKADPAKGIVLEKVTMTDTRWPASEGWVKMAQNVNGIEIHYVYNTMTSQSADFKFK